MYSKENALIIHPWIGGSITSILGRQEINTGYITLPL